jgi:hypothetical protein
MPKKQFAVLLAAVMFSGLLGGALMSWWQGQAQAAPAKAGANRLTAGEISLVDEGGKVRAQLAFREVQGVLQPGVFLYGQDGGERVGITLLGVKSQPALALSDATGGTRLWLGLNAGGAPQAVLYDTGQHLRAALGAITLQGPGGPQKLPVSSLILSDERGKLIWRAP